MIILAAWVLWKHRNSSAFEGANPRISALLHVFSEEHHLWCLAGAHSLRTLSLGQVDALV
ncbi:hypothetical protein PR202_ga16818 [Eleusine coracana subsp. coracana]|uniref:Uncharacterized protein n=1 Tax=Eleusine coracana subsp. coracana TaxID=191504 RepID=A0AAV5CMU5_ELECO|nr:hypothetical protein PR202_ga16818 [Eleusine coracana subsp. coracana]